ncbi:hypothetical protein ABZP36_017127 [Zizania latifolia]
MLFAAVAAVAIDIRRSYPDAHAPISSVVYIKAAMYIQMLWGVLELLLLAALLIFGVEPIPNVMLYVMVIVNMVVMCCTWGMACAALSAAKLVTYHRCLTMAGCIWHIVFATAALVAGALSAVTAFGTLWLLGSRYRHAVD